MFFAVVYNCNQIILVKFVSALSCFHLRQGSCCSTQHHLIVIVHCNVFWNQHQSSVVQTQQNG